MAARAGWHLVRLATFGGGWAAIMALSLTAMRQWRTSIATMLLAGIARAAMGGAVGADRLSGDLSFWGMGTLGGARLAAAAPIILAELIAAPFQARGLNGLASGEAAAAHTNIRVQRVKTTAILTTAAATGASVAVSGSSGWWASWCRICCGWCRGRITAGC